MEKIIDKLKIAIALCDESNAIEKSIKAVLESALREAEKIYHETYN